MDRVSLSLVGGEELILDLPTNHSEILFRRWVSFEFAKDEAFLYVHDHFDTLVDPEVRIRYLQLLCKALSEFFEVDLNQIYQIDVAEDLDDAGALSMTVLQKHFEDLDKNLIDSMESTLTALYTHVVNLVRSYEPELRSPENYTFEYKGDTYYMPKSSGLLFGNKHRLTSLSVAQVVEASQLRLWYKRVMSNKDPKEGDVKQHQENVRLTSALKELALLTRIKDEELPLDDAALGDFLTDRALHFIDIDAKTVLDTLFFSLLFNNN